MTKESLLNKLKEKAEDFLGPARYNFGYYVGRPLMIAGLVALAAGLVWNSAASIPRPQRTIKTQPTQEVRAVDVYKNMSAEETIKSVDDWDKARDYVLNHLKYAEHKGRQSFEETHSQGKGVCRDAAQASLTLLGDNTNRYSTFFLMLNPKNTNESGHAVALVKDKQTGGLGSLGINQEDCIEPTCTNIPQVYSRINAAFSNIFDEGHCSFVAWKNSTNATCSVRYNLNTGKIEK